MGEYTPTTEEVCKAYSDIFDPEGFDRWLLEVKAQAWERCLDEIEGYELNTDQAREGNPYRGDSSG